MVGSATFTTVASRDTSADPSTVATSTVRPAPLSRLRPCSCASVMPPVQHRSPRRAACCHTPCVCSPHVPVSPSSCPTDVPGAVRLQALLAELRGADPLAPATVGGPRSWVRLSLRRQLASGAVSATPGCGGLANVRFPTLDHLAEEARRAGAAGPGRTPLTTTACSAAARAAARPTGRAGAGRRARRHRGGRRRQLARPARGHPRRPPHLAGRGRRQADVVRLTAEVGCRLADHYDARATPARGGRRGPRPRRHAGRRHGPRRGPPAIGLPAAPPRPPPGPGCGHHGGGPGGRHRRPVGRRRGPRPRARPGATCTGIELLAVPGATAAVAAPDADTEVRGPARRRGACRRHPARPHRPRLRPASPYAALLHERCAAAGCPSSGPPRRTLAQTLAAGPPRRARPARLGVAPRRRRGLVGHRPLQHQGLVRSMPSRPTGCRAAPASRAAASAGSSGLAALADELDRRREELPFDEGRGVEGLARQAARARELAGFLQRVDRPAASPTLRPTRGSTGQRWARRLLGSLLGSVAQRGSWPAPERQAYEAVEAVLERLAGLDHLDPAADRARSARARGRARRPRPARPRASAPGC